MRCAASWTQFSFAPSTRLTNTSSGRMPGLAPSSSAIRARGVRPGRVARLTRFRYDRLALDDQVLVVIANAHDEVAVGPAMGSGSSSTGTSRSRSGSIGSTPSVKVLWPTCSLSSES